jgi:hypothetical protein
MITDGAQRDTLRAMLNAYFAQGEQEFDLWLFRGPGYRFASCG